MKSEPISTEVSKRICLHMNKDHNSSILKYAIKYGGIENPKQAEMIEINENSMILNVDGNRVSIYFDHILQDCSDAHKTLVKMIKSIPAL